MGLADDTGATATRSDGRDAHRPSEIPSQGWRAIGARVVASLKRDHVSLLAAGVAFKGLLALFPSIVALISIWGLVADPTEVADQLAEFTAALPSGAAELLNDQMQAIAASDPATLGTALAVSLLIALWSASGGMAGIIEGINAAYDEVDRRTFPVKRGLALLLTLGAIVGLLVTIALIAVLPVALGQLGLGQVGELAVRIGTWPALAVLATLGLAWLYKVSPDRDRPRMRWVSWGAVIATALWLIGSAGFTLYVENFGNFGETYGTFAGIIVLMLWLFLTAFIVLLGAEINAEMERQTRRDTTVGEPEPLGVRGAHVADTTPAHWEAHGRGATRREDDVEIDLRGRSTPSQQEASDRR
ncbi:YihY/virulence factor BrkB family protein [Nitriliruptor alkaliphilus]|uniref:YihY/virulence factor BrkB family protein n=1 Tax=Nitriliruptor alkaliphilus TaxID=427918 RepID=UPI0009F8CD95|nr:YihY/virulence factor BrkB family protein [Nitriliruptor alkaliphilus]